jgi:hypothetical protein
MLNLTRKCIEGPLSDCFPYGSHEKVSIATGIGASYLSQWANPNDERESPTYRFLQIQCALDELDPDNGEKHWNHVVQFRALSLPRTPGGLCINTELGNSAKEDADVIIAYSNGQSLYEQLAEVVEAIAQKERLKEAILDAINKEKTSPNGSNTRYARSAR